MNKIIYIIITLAIVAGIGTIFISRSKNNDDSTTEQSTQNVQIKNGVQYVTIVAKGGYSPKISTAKAGIPTKLIVKTNNTYDCSASLVIRSIGYQKILSQTGDEIIDIGTPKIEQALQGLCSMGMYNFKINFN